MAHVDPPAELAEWMETLAQSNIRSLSTGLLLDLLAIETDPIRYSDIAHDITALAEDLLSAGAYADAKTLVEALANRAGERDATGADRYRAALNLLGGSSAMREAAATIGTDRKSTRLNSSHIQKSRMPSSA